ncbi:tryptophan synthase subunit alpha [Candidatus Neomarinimicrobiota bacterium]
MSRINDLFARPGPKLIPFITAGYPQLGDTVPLVLAAEEGGAAMVEIGMPFSDPLADGPVIQAASQQAVENGVNIGWILSQVEKIREVSSIPLVLMGYCNPIFKYGREQFITEAVAAGVDGLIVPDLPPEEGAAFFAKARRSGLATIFLVAPNTANDRITHLGERAGDLLYAVSILGVTGSAGSGNNMALVKYLKRVRKHSTVPFLVGFGISTGVEAQAMSQLANGVVVGSALLRALEQAADPVAECRKFVNDICVTIKDNE